jgi:hypothetical protein
MAFQIHALVKNADNPETAIVEAIEDDVTADTARSKLRTLRAPNGP